MNEELPMLAMLQAAGPAGVPRSVIVGDLKAGAFWLRMTRLVKSGQAFHVMRGLAPGEVMYFNRKEDAEAFKLARKKAAARQQDAKKQAERKEQRKARWHLMREIIDAAGPEGIERDALAQAAGVSVTSVRGLVSKVRIKLQSKMGVRFIDGREVYFAEQYRPVHRMPTSEAPQLMRAAVVAAGAAGVPRSEMLKVVSDHQLHRYMRDLREDGLLWVAKNGAKGAGPRYFCKAEYADEWRKAKTKEKAARKAASRPAPSAKPPKPVKVAKNGATVVFAPAKPKPVAAPVQIINPNNVRPVVLPTPLPRFHVGEVGRHVSANECRPWAMYA